MHTVVTGQGRLTFWKNNCKWKKTKEKSEKIETVKHDGFNTILINVDVRLAEIFWIGVISEEGTFVGNLSVFLNEW